MKKVIGLIVMLFITAASVAAINLVCKDPTIDYWTSVPIIVLLGIIGMLGLVGFVAALASRCIAIYDYFFE